MANTSPGYEVGWNYLNTTFTGTSSQAFSGIDDFPILPEDMGTAGTLASFELRNVV